MDFVYFATTIAWMLFVRVNSSGAKSANCTSLMIAQYSVRTVFLTETYSMISRCYVRKYVASLLAMIFF